MTEQTYTITVEDIDAYLATKRDDEIIGYTCDAYNCLISEAIRWKYQFPFPTIRVLVDSDGSADIFQEKEHRDIAILALSPEICDMVKAFDMMVPLSATDNQRPLTKREWLESQVSA